MAIPFIKTLGLSERQGWSIVVRGVAEGLSSRAIQGLLQAEGWGWRRQTLLEGIRLLKLETEAGAQLRFLNRDAFPNPLRLTPALTTIRRNFSFTVELRGTLSATGADTIQHVTVTTDEIMTRSQIEDAATEAGEQGRERYGMDVTSALLIGGLRAGTAGVL